MAMLKKSRVVYPSLLYPPLVVLSHALHCLLCAENDFKSQYIAAITAISVHVLLKCTRFANNMLNYIMDFTVSGTRYDI